MIAGIINFLIDVVQFILNSLLEILPDSPFNFTSPGWQAWTKGVGWMFPLGAMVAHGVIFLTAVSGWYACRWGMRIIRGIQ